jgi:uncharacterized membrane protein (DUF373 family)
VTERNGDRRSARIGSQLAIEFFERATYAAIAVFLVITAVVLVIGTARLIVQLGDLDAVNATVVGLLDQILLLFMVAELLHTVRVTLRDRSLAVEPFLVIAIIAAVRRILVITARTETVSPGPGFEVLAIELVLLMALVLTLVVALYLWRRVYPTGDGRA